MGEGHTFGDPDDAEHSKARFIVRKVQELMAKAQRAKRAEAAFSRIFGGGRLKVILTTFVFFSETVI